jgi:hypothetical protein
MIITGAGVWIAQKTDEENGVRHPQDSTFDLRILFLSMTLHLCRGAGGGRGDSDAESSARTLDDKFKALGVLQMQVQAPVAKS